VLSLVPKGVRRVLDVGCGAGDNARRLADMLPGVAVVGVTHSAEEAEMAKPYFEAVHVFDLEQKDVSPLGGPFDLLLFSHVLEHLRDPVGVVRRLLTLLNPGGYVLIAVQTPWSGGRG
jgi:2-polyprenyl-3-methyl-5-hydroxy-6-metoxy-1,4-benzoquinol methylase